MYYLQDIQFSSRAEAEREDSLIRPHFCMTRSEPRFSVRHPVETRYTPPFLVINSQEALEKLRRCTECHFDAPAALLVCYDRVEC